MRVDNLFATSVANENIDYCVIQKYDHILKGIFKDPNQLDHDDFGVQTTKDNLHEQKDFFELVQLIDRSAKLYSEEVLGIDFRDFKMTGMWSNSHSSNSRHSYHEHSNSFFSGVLYINVPDCEAPGRIIFKDPRPAKNMQYADFKKDTEFSNKTWWYKPHTGLLLLFPSWLEHGTSLFITPTGEKRISLSFNYMLLRCKSQNTMRFEVL